MAKPKGYKATLSMRGNKKSGRPSQPDGLDRSDPEGMNVLAEAHFNDLRMRNQTERTVSSRRYGLILFLKWAQERDLRKPHEITRALLTSYQRHIWNHRKKNGQPLAVGTQLGRLAAVRGFFKWLYREEIISGDPSALMELPKEEHRLPEDTLSEAEVGRILSVPDITDPLGIRDRTLLELLYSTAIRRTEAANLKVRDISRDRQTVHIKQGKGGKDRFVPIGKRALDWLERYLDEVRPLLQVDFEDQALFLTGYGYGISSGSLGNIVAKTVKEALNRSGSCHLLRHACATHMMEHGADSRVIQQLLGHAKLETTQIYTEISIRFLREVHAKTHPLADSPAAGER